MSVLENRLEALTIMISISNSQASPKQHTLSKSSVLAMKYTFREAPWFPFNQLLRPSFLEVLGLSASHSNQAMLTPQTLVFPMLSSLSSL